MFVLCIGCSYVNDRKCLSAPDPQRSLYPSLAIISTLGIASIPAHPGALLVTMSKSISPSEVSAHNSVDKGLYIIIDSIVYDMTGFVDEHPGGAKILKRVGGKDASKQFWKVSHSSCGRCRRMGRNE